MNFLGGTFFFHLFDDLLCTFLVDSDLRLDDHVVDESDERAQTAVVASGQFQDLVLK